MAFMPGVPSLFHDRRHLARTGDAAHHGGSAKFLISFPRSL